MLIILTCYILFFGKFDEDSDDGKDEVRLG